MQLTRICCFAAVGVRILPMMLRFPSLRPLRGPQLCLTGGCREELHSRRRSRGASTPWSSFVTWCLWKEHNFGVFDRSSTTILEEAALVGAGFDSLTLLTGLVAWHDFSSRPHCPATQLFIFLVWPILSTVSRWSVSNVFPKRPLAVTRLEARKTSHFHLTKHVRWTLLKKRKICLVL